MSEKTYFLFDQECTLCSRFTQVLQKIKGYEDFEFVPLQQANEIDLFKDIPQTQLETELHIFSEGKFHRGPEAVEFLMKRNPLIKKHMWLMDHQMTKKAIGSFYKAIDKARKSRLLCNSCGNKHS